MTEKDVVDFLESCNFETRKPTENFIKLKEEYDTQVVPRRKILKELGFLEICNKELEKAVIKEEQKFMLKLLLQGELQKYFFTEDLAIKKYNIKAGIKYPFKYSVKVSDIPSELYQEMCDTFSKYENIDKNIFNTVKMNIDKFYDFAARVLYRTTNDESFTGLSVGNLFSLVPVKFCKIGKIVIECWNVNDYLYFIYEVGGNNGKITRTVK